MMNKIKISDLNLDYSFYPRSQINPTLVSALRDAVDGGAVLPPIVVWRSRNLVTDGFHRVEETRKRYGNGGEIEVEWKDYSDEVAFFEDAMRLNSSHGQRLNTYDMTHCKLIGKGLGLPDVRIADALGVMHSRLESITQTKVAYTPDTHEPVPIKRTLRSFAQQELTEKQLQGNKIASGKPQTYQINQIINLLEHDILDVDSPTVMERLNYLHELLHQI